MARPDAADAPAAARHTTIGWPSGPTTPAWQRRLFDAGYAGTIWPTEYGGRGLTPTEELIFLEETEAAGAPYVGCNFVGTLHAGPTMGAEGNAEQKAKHLPGSCKGEHVWCQGFSEPECRVGPRVAADEGRCATATTTS